MIAAESLGCRVFRKAATVVFQPPDMVGHIDRHWAEEFARDWIAAWNAHDLDRILAHYADDFEMTSPFIVERLGIASGWLKGKDAIRRYWGQGLAKTPALHFDLINVLVGVNSVALIYKSVTAQ